MSINLPQGFNVQSRESIDKRFVLTKSQMLAVNDNVMPEKYFAVCKDDKQIYIYDKEATANEETGKFASTSSLSVASDSTAGTVKSCNSVDSITVNNDGTMSVNQISVDKLTNSEGTVLVLDGGSAPVPVED